MPAMELYEKIELIETKEDLADFVALLKADLDSSSDDWENPNLERYLEAMGAWICSMDNAYKNMGKEFPDQPTWKMLADILYAAKLYE
jgi:hypothetical protein